MNYDITKYERPSVAVDSVVFSIKNLGKDSYRNNANKKLAVLLIKRKETPYLGKYALPGGFLRSNETVPEATLRELKEETGIETEMTHLGIYSNINRDPRGWIISIASLALIPECKLKSDEHCDAEEAQWFSMDIDNNTETITLFTETEKIEIAFKDKKIISSDLSFDHAQILLDAYFKLNELILNKNFLFALLPEEFKISDIQTIYELITNKKEAPANFRRKIKSYIQETSTYSSEEGHRPSQFFKRKEN